jgi:hypothetical protein
LFDKKTQSTTNYNGDDRRSFSSLFKVFLESDAAPQGGDRDVAMPYDEIQQGSCRDPRLAVLATATFHFDSTFALKRVKKIRTFREHFAA